MSKYGLRLLEFLKEYKLLCERHNLCITGGIGAITAIIKAHERHMDWLRFRIVEIVGEEERLSSTERASILDELGY